MSNREQWDFLQSELKSKLGEFVKTVFPELPQNLYKVEHSGWLKEGFDIRPYYLYPFKIFLNGSRPTKVEISQLSKCISDGIEFSVEKLSFEYSYLWGDNKEYKASTGISYKDFVSMNPPYFTDKEKATEYAKDISNQRASEKEFDELHKKDKNYDYRANGYKDLGWQNSWHHVYFDEDGKETTGDILKGEKPKRTFGYRKEDYPEYGKCREMGHRTVEVSHNNRGSHHDVSCPVCKLLWKYDSSD